MIADTRITDPTTGEVLAEPGQALDAEQLYRLEIGVGLPLAARAAAHAARATHEDMFDPLRFWKQMNGRVYEGRYGCGPWRWELSWRTYPPPWVGRI